MLKTFLKLFCGLNNSLVVVALLAASTARVGAISTPINIGQNANNTSGTTIAVTVPAAGVPLTNTIIVTFAMDPTSGTVSVTDSGGNTYTKDADVVNGSSGSGVRTLVFSAAVTNDLVSGNSITVTFPSTTAKAVSAFYVGGLVSATPVDRSATATGNSSSPSSGATAATTQASELLIGAMGTESRTSVDTMTAGGTGTYTLLNNASADSGSSSSSITIFPEYQIAGSTGAQTASGTLTSSRNWAAAIVTYKAGTTTTTTLATSGTPATYGTGVTFTATVSPNTATGTVLFYDGTTFLGSATLTGTTTKTAALTTTATQLAAGTHSSITAFYLGDSARSASVSSALSQTISAVAVQLSGTRIYDGTTEAASSDLTVANNLDGANLTLTGSGTLSSKDVGSPTIAAAATPLRVNSATGAVGASAATSFTVTVPSPQNGNTLIAVISTRRTSASAVSSITESGATWTRAVQTSGTDGTTTEIWYATNLVSASTTVTINLAASLFASAVVMEYQDMLTASPVDQTASTTATTGTTASTGTTPTTTQGNELWIGGIGLTNSTLTLSSLQNSFAEVANSVSGSATATANSRVYALERIVSSTATASSGGTISASARWSGAIAAFKAQSLSLSGSAAGNYTLAGMTGSLTITPKALAITGLAASSKSYDGTTNATITGTATLSATEAPGNGTNADGKPYNVDSVSAGGTPAGAFANSNVGTAKPVTVTGVTITGTGSGNYTATQPTGLTANITALAIQLSGTRVYDGTTVATSSSLSVANNFDGANLTLSGNVALAGKDVGSQVISAGSLPSRINSATGGNSGGTTISMTISAPANGNTLIATISTRGNVASQVSSITQTGATWSRVTQAVNTGGVTTEIWYATNLVSASTTLTINLASSLRAAAVVTEYDGLLSATSVDQTNNATGSSTSAVTGSTPVTGQSNELWIASIGLQNPNTLSSPLGGFTSFNNAASSGTPSSINTTVYALEKIVTTNGVASSGGTVSASSAWAGAVATFKAELPSGSLLTLGGSAAGNYTVTNLSGSVTITTKALTYTGPTVPATKLYNRTNTAVVSGSAVLQTAEAIGAGTTTDNKPYNVDSVTLTGTPTATYNSKDVATASTVTFAGLSLTGTGNGNYALTALTQAATISKTNLTVTAAANSKSYDGGTNAAAIPNVTAGNIQSGDTASFTETYDTKNVGSSKIMTPAGTVSDGTGGNNYNYTFLTSANGTITGASLTITASNQSKTFGSALALGTSAFSNGSGLASGESVTAVNLVASGGTNALDATGTYTITPSAATGTGGFLASNYSLTYINGTLTVNKATTSVVVTSSSNPNHSYASVFFTATLPSSATGTVRFKTNSTALSTNSLSSGVATSVATASLPRGTHTITAEYAGDGNYLGSTNNLSGGQVMTNSAPVANTATYARAPGLNLRIKKSLLLAASASDVDGDALTVSSVGTGTNSATITSDATYIYYVPAANNNNDSFTYTVSDGQGGATSGNILVLVAKQGGAAQSITVGGGSVSVTFAGIPGYTYDVQRDTNATFTTASVLLTTNAPSGGVFIFTDSSPPSPSAYYRLFQH